MACPTTDRACTSNPTNVRCLNTEASRNCWHYRSMALAFGNPRPFASEASALPHTVYNTALEQHLRDTLGVRFAERPGTDPAKRPIREIVGVDPRLNQRWSTRRAHINTRRGELAIQFQQDHGRPPTPVEALQLAQQATLETRDAKHEPRSLTEQRSTWLSEAAAVLGGRGAVAAMVQTALHPARRDRHDRRRPLGRTDGRSHPGRDGEQPLHLADVACPGRSTTAGPHHRRAANMPAALVDLLVDEVLDRRSVALAAPDDGIEEPEALRRVDGSSVYTVAGADLYTSQRILDAEQRLVATAGRRDGSAVDADGGGSGAAGDGGERHRPRCRAGRAGPPDVHLGCPAAARDRPGRRRENHRHARPRPGLDPRRRPGARPRPVGCRGRCPRASRPASAPTRSPNSPGPYTTASCPTGRPRSARQHW